MHVGTPFAGELYALDLDAAIRSMAERAHAFDARPHALRAIEETTFADQRIAS
jgi:hypothetical protein